MTAIFQQLLAEAAQLSWVDWVVTVTALIYVVLAARENIWCWFWGIISCSLWAYASFVFYDLWLDALLQVFYVIMGFVGIYRWRYGSRSGSDLPVSRMPRREMAWTLAGGSLLAWIFGTLFDEYTPAAATYLDATTTVFSIITTFLLVQKRLESWLYWVVIDALYAYLYFSRGAYLFALLMVLYTGIAISAYFQWRRTWYQINTSEVSEAFEV